MSNKTHFVMICMGIVLSVASLAWGQEVQRLECHVAREAHKLLYDMGKLSIALMEKTPRGVELPRLRDGFPLFCRWETPLVKKGYLPIVLDRTRRDGPCDLLYIDTNGDGSLKDEKAERAWQANTQYVKFGPVKIDLAGEDGPIRYHLNFELSYVDQGKNLHIYSGNWREGTIQFGEEKIYCVLIDRNVNGTFNDKSIDSEKCDWIRVGKNTYFVGNYLEVNGQFYDSVVAADGAEIKLNPADNLSFGTVGLPASLTELDVGGENGKFLIKPEQGQAKLPMGKYRVYRWVVERKDEQGVLWKLEGISNNNFGDFTVSWDDIVKLRIGEQIVPDLKIEKKSETLYSFELKLNCRLADTVALTRSKEEPDPPKLHINNADGSYDKTYSFVYG